MTLTHLTATIDRKHVPNITAALKTAERMFAEVAESASDESVAADLRRYAADMRAAYEAVSKAPIGYA